MIINNSDNVDCNNNNKINIKKNLKIEKNIH